MAMNGFKKEARVLFIFPSIYIYIFFCWAGGLSSPMAILKEKRLVSSKPQVAYTAKGDESISVSEQVRSVVTLGDNGAESRKTKSECK